MPQRERGYSYPPGMSWLSPKRRRTTGNLKNIQNGQVNSSVVGTDAPSPIKERPPSRPLSQTMSVNAIPTSSSNARGDGNLFYAYARRGDDLRSRYLLTFASAGTAQEWWTLAQQHFPDVTRPGPQLFSFQQEDLLGKAWKHNALAHLKTKWMYISFSDAGNVGGATQGIIPIQDMEGNLLGGGSPAASAELGRIEKETKEARLEAEKSQEETGKMKTEVERLEDHFERMMMAVERNTKQIAVLAESRTLESTEEANGHSENQSSEMSSHLGRISYLLQNNMEHVEDLAKRQLESEQKLRSTLEESSRKQRADRIDLLQLSKHLDRIQRLMERDIEDRNDDRKDNQPRIEIDLSPLTERLGKVQEAVEQNSALVKRLLEDGSAAPAPITPSESQQPSIDLSPLSEQLDRIHAAIEQQSHHMQDLLGAAQDQDREPHNNEDSPLPSASTFSLAPLSEHLEHIHTAIEDGNRSAKDKNLDLSPLSEHLAALRESNERNASYTKELLDSQAELREALAGELDFTPMAEHFEAIQDAMLENTDILRSLLNKQEASRSLEGADFTPLTDRLSRIQVLLERQAESPRRDESPGNGNGSAKFVMNALSSHLSKIQAVTEANASQFQKFRQAQSEAQDKMQVAITDTASIVKSVAERQDRQDVKARTNEDQIQELTSTMKELTRAIMASKCDHVVIPPPRKTGRKVVGFVYDAKDGDGGDSPSTLKSAMKKY